MVITVDVKTFLKALETIWSKSSIGNVEVISGSFLKSSTKISKTVD